MLNIKIVCVGKIKDSFYKDAVAEYAKRLTRFCKFEVIEVNEELVDPSLKNLDLVKQKEDKVQKLVSGICPTCGSKISKESFKEEWYDSFSSVLNNFLIEFEL